jgi:hypothetical protein
MTTIPRIAASLAFLLALLGAGCSSTTTSPPEEPPPAASSSPDEAVLHALDYLEPMYQFNADGRVIKLRITGRHLPLSALKEIDKLTELRAIDFYGTTLTDEGLAELKDLQHLRNAGLAGTPLSDRAASHLAKLQSLQWVWLPQHGVSKEAVDKLKQARPDMNVYLQ